MENLKIKTAAEEDFFIEEIEKIARSAGEIVMAHYARGAAHEFKSERQVVTGADGKSEQLLKESLKSIPVIFIGKRRAEILPNKAISVWLIRLMGQKI